MGSFVFLSFNVPVILVVFWAMDAVISPIKSTAKTKNLLQMVRFSFSLCFIFISN